MNYKEIASITPQFWISNLVGVAEQIADKENQEKRWLAPDANPWEHPEELINSLFDDCVFEGFIEQYASTFSEEQRHAASELRGDMNKYCDATPPHVDSKAVLADPRWHTIRDKAAAFVAAFKDKWPAS